MNFILFLFFYFIIIFFIIIYFFFYFFGGGGGGRCGDCVCLCVLGGGRQGGQYWPFAGIFVSLSNLTIFWGSIKILSIF